MILLKLYSYADMPSLFATSLGFFKFAFRVLSNEITQSNARLTTPITF